jgi:hypothetical protein
MKKVEGSNPLSRFPGSGSTKPQVTYLELRGVAGSETISAPGTDWVFMRVSDGAPTATAWTPTRSPKSPTVPRESPLSP